MGRDESEPAVFGLDCEREASFMLMCDGEIVELEMIQSWCRTGTGACSAVIDTPAVDVRHQVYICCQA